MARLREAAEPLSREDLLRTFQVLSELEVGLKASSQPRFLFEAALLRLADLGAVVPIENLLRGLPARAASSGRHGRGRPVSTPPALAGRIRSLRAGGWTLQAICDVLNAESQPTPRGGSHWRPSSLRAILRNPKEET